MNRYELRNIQDLEDVEDPAWPEIVAFINSSDTTVTVLPITHERGQDTLQRIQVTARSYLGALALNCGGLITNNGWLRILGGGTEELPGLADINKIDNVIHVTAPPGLFIVAYDVIGGLFTINGGSIPNTAQGEVCYLPPEQSDWLSTGSTHSDFVAAALSGGINGFYEEYRWDNWEEETEKLSLTQAFSFFPPLSTVEGSDVNKSNRKPVPVKEVFFGII
jgi:hypothetical protein